MSDEERRKLLEQLTIGVHPELSALLKCSRFTAYEMVRNNKIPSIKVGAHYRIPTAPLRRLLGMEGGDARAA